MRHYLLASVAVLGLSAGAANAALIPTTGSADPNLNAQAVTAPQSNPDPGKVIVRLGGWMAFVAGVMGATTDKGEAGTANANAKNDPYGFQGFMHFYLGVDGKTTNGIIYGANLEIRSDNSLAVGAFGGSATVTQTAQTNANSSTNTTNSFLYLRRAIAYIGTDQLGIFRFGGGDDPNDIFLGATTGETYSRGGWDGDVEDFLGNSTLTWAFADLGATYTTNRAVWISPTWSGFNLALAFAPSTTVIEDGTTVDAAYGGSDRQSQSTLLADAGRARNIYEALGKWSGNLGPVAAYGLLAYTGSDIIKYVGPLSTTAANAYHGLSVIDAGTALTYAGVTLYGHLTTGKMNGPSTPEPITPHSKNGLAYVVGPQYGWGPYTVGGQFYVFESTGSASLSPTVGARMERGLSAGFGYTMAPGLWITGDYVYGTRHERGVNFTDPAGPSTDANNTRAQAFAITMNVKW